jgi:hypothetical protein
MLTGSSAVPDRRWLAIALASLLALTLALTAGPAGAAKSGRAVEAKKCKKAKKGAASAKKRKCKKKRHVVAIPGPLVRATITWPSGEVDLHAFDAGGNRSGIAFPCSSNPCPMAEGIPNAVHSPDANNGGSESFTDNVFVQGGAANREFAYAVCFYTSTTVNVTVVNAVGTTQVIPITDTAGGAHTVSTQVGPQVPASFSCPT